MSPAQPSRRNVRHLSVWREGAEARLYKGVPLPAYARKRLVWGFRAAACSIMKCDPNMSLTTMGKWNLDPPFTQPKCGCDDAGCDRCCDTEPLTLDDLELIDEEIAHANRRTVSGHSPAGSDHRAPAASD